MRFIRAAFPYRGSIPSLLHNFKYRGQRTTGAALAGWMGGRLAEFPELWGADALVPIPLHPEREKERGFNQAVSLAQPAAILCGKRMECILERIRPTAPQWGLDRRRRLENLRDAFRVRINSEVEGRSFLLLDDVCTTGTTLENCAQLLLEAGASSVDAYVLARD